MRRKYNVSLPGFVQKSKPLPVRDWIIGLLQCNTPRSHSVALFVQQGTPANGLRHHEFLQEDANIMTRTSTVTTLAVSAVIAGSIALGSAPAKAQQIPQGWFKVCSKQEDNDICNVQNLVFAETKQLVTGVSLIEIKGKINRRIFQVAVPTGRTIPAGIAMQIDDGQAQKMNYAVCLPDRCIAEAPLTDELVASMKKGGDVTFTSVNFQNKPNPIKISLEGFTAAYDGPPMAPSDLQAKQKQLQEEIQKRRSDFEQKLKAEQDKAKSDSAN
jgi:invasion protein IalB